jgi:hypothetical protein
MLSTCIWHCSPLARPLGLMGGAAVILLKKTKKFPRRDKSYPPIESPETLANPGSAGGRSGGGAGAGGGLRGGPRRRPAREEAARRQPGLARGGDGGPRRRRGARRRPEGGRRRGRLGRTAVRRPSPAAGQRGWLGDWRPELLPPRASFPSEAATAAPGGRAGMRQRCEDSAGMRRGRRGDEAATRGRWRWHGAAASPRRCGDEVPARDGSEPTAVEYWALINEALERLATTTAADQRPAMPPRPLPTSAPSPGWPTATATPASPR